jgi:hypothetical protein
VRLLRERFAGVTRQRLLFDALVRKKEKRKEKEKEQEKETEYVRGEKKIGCCVRGLPSRRPTFLCSKKKRASS